MTKNLKTSFILYIIFYCVLIAWATLSAFFKGVGINFVALIVVLGLLLSIKLTDSHVSNRTKELFWASVAFAGVEFLFYFFIEFGIARGKFYIVLDILQHIFTGFSLLAFAYVIFRYITEIKNVKVTFVEILLGNEKPIKKVRSNKELTNGSLEEKPNKVDVISDEDFHKNSNFTNVQTNETASEPETKDEF